MAEPHRMLAGPGELEVVEDPREAERREQLAAPEPVPSTFADIERRLAERARRRAEEQR
jgi:hypothetical protein